MSKEFLAILGYVKYWIVKDNMLYYLWKQYDSFISPYFKNIFICKYDKNINFEKPYGNDWVYNAYKRLFGLRFYKAIKYFVLLTFVL